jgi:hypothetical protein
MWRHAFFCYYLFACIEFRAAVSLARTAVSLSQVCSLSCTCISQASRLALAEEQLQHGITKDMLQSELAHALTLKHQKEADPIPIKHLHFGVLCVYRKLGVFEFALAFFSRVHLDWVAQAGVYSFTLLDNKLASGGVAISMWVNMGSRGGGMDDRRASEERGKPS